MIPWLGAQPIFPPISQALQEPNGLLAAGGELAPEWLLAAYTQGIFPWFTEGDPILWWSPDPRMVVFPAELRITRSLRKTLRNGPFEVRCDTVFPEVIAACAAPRASARGTWITAAMQAAYSQLHTTGWAHSIECWRNDQLVGGLYGIAIGRAFYGESMFHRERDASKVAFAYLVRWLEAQGFGVIDCQMNTTHLASLGGREIGRSEFATLLAECVQGAQPERWPERLVMNDW